jgi:hypothetical protein
MYKRPVTRAHVYPDGTGHTPAVHEQPQTHGAIDHRSALLSADLEIITLRLGSSIAVRNLPLGCICSVR